MSIRGKTAIVGIGETPTDRLGSKPGEPRKSTAEYLAWAARLAMEDAGLTKKDFEGQGLAAIYTTNHSQPFWPEEVAAILGITPGVSLAGGNGGASSVSLLGHAAAAITAGLCDLVLVIRAGRSVHGTRGSPRRIRRHPRLRNALWRHGTELQNFLRHEPLHARVGDDGRTLRQDRRHRTLSCVAQSQRLSEKADHHRRLQEVASDFRSNPAFRLRDAGQRWQGLYHDFCGTRQEHAQAAGVSLGLERV